MKRLLLVLVGLWFISCGPALDRVLKDPCRLMPPGSCVAPTPVVPVEYCSVDKKCSCYVCIDSERDRIGLGSAEPCVHPAYVACPTPAAPTATSTPTPTNCPTGTHRNQDPCATCLDCEPDCPPGQIWTDAHGGGCTDPNRPRPTPWPTETPRPSPEPAATATPAPTVEPAPGHPGEACMLDGPPWLRPAPPNEAIPVERIGPCPKGFRPIDYEDRNSGRFRHGCMVDWQCAAGTNGRSPWTGTVASVPGHVRFDERGFVVDLDNSAACGVDALGRKECNGVLTPSMWEGKEEKPWVNPAAACDPPRCAEATPIPTAKPTTGPPSTSCAPVEAIEHWIVGGGHCHAWRPMADGRIRCTLDSTVRPICDTDHMDNWNSFCGLRTHDPNYDSPDGAQFWTIQGAEDLGPNSENSAQRVIAGPAGGEVSVTVCLRPDAVTVDGCRIPVRGDACNRTTWTLPRGGE